MRQRVRDALVRGRIVRELLPPGKPQSGFIGTEAEVPDEVAAIFSRAFYSRLLAGDSVGESMLAARWELLTHHHSVLGLLYNLYANPDMRVELAS